MADLGEFISSAEDPFIVPPRVNVVVPKLPPRRLTVPPPPRVMVLSISKAPLQAVVKLLPLLSMSVPVPRGPWDTMPSGAVLLAPTARVMAPLSTETPPLKVLFGDVRLTE